MNKISKFTLKSSMANALMHFDESYKDNKTLNYQAKIDKKFAKSTTYEIIEAEIPYASNNWVQIEARVISVNITSSGDKSSDNYKKIIFKGGQTQIDIDYNAGYMYRFDGNYWICRGTEMFERESNSVSVYRCNNFLKWIDDYGAIQSIPCAFVENDYYLTNETKQEVVRNSGYTKIYIQRNDITRKLYPNQRFIFGDSPDSMKCLKITGGGIRDYINQFTYDDGYKGLELNPAVTRITMEYDYVNTETDDLIVGIANAYDFKYSVKINESYTYDAISDTYILNAFVEKNNIITDIPLIWEIDSDIANINILNNDAYIKFNEDGIINVKCFIDGNENIFDSLELSSNSKELYTIEYSPYINKIYKNEEYIYNFNLFKDGIMITDAIFDISYNNIDEKYCSIEILSNNEIKIKNNNMSKDTLNIICKCLNYVSEDINLDIIIGGAW